MSYKPPMGDPNFLQKRPKPAPAPTTGRGGGSSRQRYDTVEAVVYTGTSSSMMDMVRSNEPSVKQQPGELFRRVRPTTVANFVEQQVMEQRRQQYEEGGGVGAMGGGGFDDETLAQYRSQVEPLEEHRDLAPQQQQYNNYSNSNSNASLSYQQQQYPSPPSGGQRRSNSSAGGGGGGGGSRRGDGLLRGPQGGLVYIDRTAGGAARPPSRTSTAGDPNFYNSGVGYYYGNPTNDSALRSGSSKGVPQNVVSPLGRHEQQDPDTVARYNNTIASSLRPDNSNVSRVGEAGGGNHIGAGVIVQGPMRRPLPKAPNLTPAQQGLLTRQQQQNESPNEDGELPFSQRQMLILDVREKEAYDQCHIIGAFHFPQIRLAHATNPYSLPEILRFKNKKNHMIILYDLEEEITVARKMGNIFFEKGCDNVFVMAGGLREFVQTHNHLVVGECPVPVVAKSSRLGAYGADKSTLGSYANRSVTGGGGNVSRMGTNAGGGARRSGSSASRVGSTVGGMGVRVPVGLSSSLAKR